MFLLYLLIIDTLLYLMYNVTNILQIQVKIIIKLLSKCKNIQFKKYIVFYYCEFDVTNSMYIGGRRRICI